MIFANLIYAVVLLLLFAGLFLLANSSLGGLDFTTNKLAVRNIIKILKERNLNTGEFYDLGSCRGGLSIKIAQGMPKMTVIGIDNSPTRTLIANIRSADLKNLRFTRENLFITDVSGAAVVYLYLPQELMEGLQIKLQKELKKDSLVLSYKVPFPNWEPVQIFEQLFIYQV